MLEVTVIETLNSYYIVDTKNLRYQRICKDLEGRSFAEVANLSPALLDDTWVNLANIEKPITIYTYHDGVMLACLRYEGSTHGVLTSEIISVTDLDWEEQIPLDVA